jgi:sialic acid synthase SpsE
MDKFYVVRPNDLIVNITFAWEQAIAIVRPDIGLAPREEENVMGRVARRTIPYSKGINWDDLY